ncbi:MAG: 30S ribosome-binding factor RbfA [Hyphomicrobiales bacterium]|nr:30S ribosome-binding factor RbfA [Hyphomicrobiales bacterium]
MSRSHHSQSGEPSQRMLRVAELVRHAMSDILSRGLIHDPVLDAHVVTAPRVKMSPDLKLATIYIMPLGGGDADAVLKALDRRRPAIRTEIAHRIALKFAPDVRFRIDDTFENSARIDALLNSDKVRRDLQKDEDQPADDDKSGDGEP